jgi:acyl-CoA thioesterase-2
MDTCADGHVLEELLSLLKLEMIEENIFRGQSQDLGFGSVFGGQVLGQTLSAASQTVPDNRHAHSLHGYFLCPGDAFHSIIYNVDCIRDGSSFSTRRVVAIQKGRPIFFMASSFQTKEQGFEHQDEMPAVPGPEGIESDTELARRVQKKIPPAFRDRFLCKKPIEMRPVEPMNPFAPEKRSPRRFFWFRSIGPIPDEMATHLYLLAYASDWGMVTTSLYPHGHNFWEPAMQVASLDHAIWFHRDFHLDDWLLYEMVSPSAGRGRGLVHGRIFTQNGLLVASVIQEGLIRFHGHKKSVQSIRRE